MLSLVEAAGFIDSNPKQTESSKAGALAICTLLNLSSINKNSRAAASSYVQTRLLVRCNVQNSRSKAKAQFETEQMLTACRAVLSPK